jgi:hypothetical protein
MLNMPGGYRLEQLAGEWILMRIIAAATHTQSLISINNHREAG